MRSNALFAALATCWVVQTVYLSWGASSWPQNPSVTERIGSFTGGNARTIRGGNGFEDVPSLRQGPSAHLADESVTLVEKEKADQLNGISPNGSRRSSTLHRTRPSVAIAKRESEYHVIDAVFTYVNGSDPELQRQMARFGGKVDPSRFRDFGQLRYAMRSAFINAPFVRNFFVVVSNKTTQIPSWMDASHPRIRVLEHAEIWDDPADLPSMNSNAIEWATMNIPGIAPLYLLFNDDTAIQKPLNISSVWLNAQLFVLHQAWEAPRHETDANAGSGFGKSVAFVYQLYNKRYGFRERKVASHIPILLNTSVMRRIKDEFAEEFSEMYRSKPFRTNRDMQTQFAYQQYVIEHYPHTVLTNANKHVHYVNKLTYSGVSRNQRILRSVRNSPRQYLCVQDRFKSNLTSQVLDQIRGFYEEVFPTKAPWEMDTVPPAMLWNNLTQVMNAPPRKRVRAKAPPLPRGKRRGIQGPHLSRFGAANDSKALKMAAAGCGGDLRGLNERCKKNRCESFSGCGGTGKPSCCCCNELTCSGDGLRTTCQFL